MTTPPIRVLIADDHPVVRVGLRNMLLADSLVKVVGEARDGVEALELARKLRPDILLLDLAMPHVAGMDALREMTSGNLNTRTIEIGRASCRERV